MQAQGGGNAVREGIPRASNFNRYCERRANAGEPVSMIVT
jgi:hypothetical protein